MREEYKRLLEMVKNGMPDKEIMRELGIKTKAKLKRMYYNALVEAGKIKDILTEREARKAKKRTLTISKRGTVILGKSLLIDEMGFKVGDKLIVSRRRDSIILKKEKEVPSAPPSGSSEQG